MRAALWMALGVVATAGGCSGFQVSTKSFVRMLGQVRTEIAPVVDLGAVVEVPVPPAAGSGACCKSAGPKVAVIDVDGLISNDNHSGPYSLGENPVALFKEKLDAAAADPNVRAVVLRINTPGGGVAATDLIWHELKQFRAGCHKPVVACLLDLGCGGGYYLATACDAVVAAPSGVVGGLGVLLNLYEAKEGMALVSIFEATVRSGAKVDMGSPVRTVTEEERAILESMARSYHERFKDVVVGARPKVPRDSPLFDGRVMTGAQARDAGLVDALGYPDDAIRLACQLGQAESAAVVMYRRPGDAARTVYATTPNRPIHPSLLPMSIPGLERSKLPLFLYMWQVEPTFVRLNGM